MQHPPAFSDDLCFGYRTVFFDKKATCHPKFFWLVQISLKLTPDKYSHRL
jgi:hypothetical protein